MKQIKNILIIILLLVIGVLLIDRGCDAPSQTKENQNKMANKDSSYSKIKDIKAVKKELGNSELGKEVRKIEKSGERITTLTRTVVKYVHDTTYLENIKFVKSDNNLMYTGLFSDSLFRVEVENNVKLKYDSVRSMYVFDTAFTKLNNIDFRFGIALVRSVDKDGYLRVRSKAYYLDRNNEFLSFVPENKLRLITDDIVIEKTKVPSNWAVTLSPISVGYFYTQNGFVFGVGPNIGISYRISFKK